MDPITASAVRYIKLGPGGAWVERCLANSEIEFGYAGEPFDRATAGDWDGVVAHYVRQGKIVAKARDAMREIQNFFTLGPACLWITFADHHLWWTFAEPGVIVNPSPQPGHGVCRRRALGGWRKTDIGGGALRIDGLTSKLTQVAAYRQTICSVKASDYLLRRINTVPEPSLVDARSARTARHGQLPKYANGAQVAVMDSAISSSPFKNRLGSTGSMRSAWLPRPRWTHRRGGLSARRG